MPEVAAARPGGQTQCAQVAVWLPLHQTYSYLVPDHLRASDLVGARVLVPLGNRAVTGVVLEVGEIQTPGAKPETSSADGDSALTLRPIKSVIDIELKLSGELIALCRWIARYYEAPIGEVLRAAMPGGVNVSGDATVELTARGKQALDAGGALATKQRDILGALGAAGGSMLRRQILRPTSGSARARSIRHRALRSGDLDELLAAGLVRYGHQIHGQTVRPRTVRTAVLTRSLTDEVKAQFARSPKKLAALRALEEAGGAAAVPALKASEPHISNHLRALARDGMVRFEERATDPLVARAGILSATSAPRTPPVLNERQRAALATIRAGLGQGRFSSYLLHGITGSGKTEIYLNAIGDVLEQGGTAIVLVPEISLTPQLAARFRARFGDRVAVLHSALSSRERFDEWHRLKTGRARIALGARSAVFAPVANLRVVVVDEEHDSSFKQDEGVRYNGRDVALVRAQRAGAVCILGSATPALETFHGANTGRYKLLSLPRRATPRPLPQVSLIDLRVYRPDSEAMLTAPLSRAMAETLERGEQIILFLNRRGFATFVLCIACGEPFRCTQCSVTLTYHRAIDRLLCHYCGYRQRVPADCPSCQTPGAIKRKGLGTEKVAAAVADAFAGARVARLDRDVASGARIGPILDRVARREVDILVGTQMVTKGHDFPGVTLVGVLCADTALSLPDFRASERTFQLLTQVAGRAGRGDKPGQVLIQSYNVQVPAIARAAEHDYEGFYAAECAARQEMGYPPFGHLVALRIDGKNPSAVERTARDLAARADIARRQFSPGVVVLGPCEAPLVRLKGRTRWQVWLRSPDRKTLRRFLGEVVIPGSIAPGGARITVDVDPISAL